MQPRLGIFLARDPWSGDQLRPGSMNGWNYGDDNPVNRVDPSGLFSALTWARSAGFSADIPGVSQWLSNLDPHWGWAKMLLDADEGDFAYVWGRTPPWDISPYGRFYCENGKAHINIEPAEFREGNENRGDFVPLPGGYRGSTAGLDPSGLGWAWRDQVGATLLSSKTGVRTDYRDGGNSGNIIDLPDFVLYGGVDLPVEIPIPGVSGVTPALSAFIIDRYGNLYSSVGVGGGVIGGINFYGEGYMFKSFTQNISFATEEELKNALVWLSLSGGGGFGAKIDVSIGWGFTGCF